MAKPPTRVASAAPAAPPRALMRDVGGAIGSVEIVFDVRSAFDFVFSLSGHSDDSDDLLSADRRWLRETRARLPESVRAILAGEAWVALAGLAVGRPALTDAASFLAMVRELPGRALAEAVVADDFRRPEIQPTVQAALQGEDEAIERLVATWHEHKRPFLSRLLRDPDGTAADLVQLFEAWVPAYQEIEPRVAVMIRRDVELRSQDRATLAPIDLIERTTGGIRWLSEPGVRRVILAPSYFARPYNYVLAADDWRMFGYPIADAALDVEDPLAPPQSVVRLHRALGDDSRLRILRLLRDRDWYLSEIAERVELSKPTIKHHLALLRAAGLVTLIEEGGLSYYSLRRDRLDDASADLKRFLLG